MTYEVLQTTSLDYSTKWIIRALTMGSLISLLTGCTPLQQYRTGYPPHSPAQVGAQTNTIEEGTNYLIGFVEFDDHGWLWNPNQMKTVLERVTREDEANGVLVVVFAHGWKHNASWDDANVKAFRAVLRELQDLEITNSAQHLAQDGSPLPLHPRKVVGVYLGWRGLSQQLWGLKEFTFWERKRTAHSVGQGAVSEVLVELEEIRKRSRIVHKDEETNHVRQPTMLVIVGHSFGGAVVYSAIAPLLQEHLIDVIDTQGNPKPPRGFGDLVVLVNPAYEAARFEILKRSSDARAYITNQPATLAIFTSKADWATKIAFKLGRRVSTIFEKNRKDMDQYGANITAVGHYQPYITHDLNFDPPKPSAPGLPAPPPAKTQRVGAREYHGGETTGESAQRIRQLRGQVRRNKAKPKDAPVSVEESTYQFSQTKLVPREKVHKAHDPIYVVAVDKKIIPSHAEFETEAFITFLREFIFTFTGNPQTQ